MDAAFDDTAKKRTRDESSTSSTPIEPATLTHSRIIPPAPLPASLAPRALGHQQRRRAEQEARATHALLDCAVKFSEEQHQLFHWQGEPPRFGAGGDGLAPVIAEQQLALWELGLGDASMQAVHDQAVEDANLREMREEEEVLQLALQMSLVDR